MRVHPSYSPEFRADALEVLRKSDRSIPQVADDLGVSSETLREWYKRSEMAKKKPKKGRVGRAAGSVPASAVVDESAEDCVRRLERENAALRKEIDSLRMDREILKKAAAFFAKENE